MEQKSLSNLLTNEELRIIAKDIECNVLKVEDLPEINCVNTSCEFDINKLKEFVGKKYDGIDCKDKKLVINEKVN